MSKDKRKNQGGNGGGGVKADTMKTYREGERFPGRIGRTYEESEPAFPMPPKAPKDAPNILYVILDDVGFGWCEPFGGMIRTPTLMKLAQQGLRYTYFTTTALCSPTRSCLVTGRNHHSVGMANITELATGFPGYNGRQPQDKAGVPAMLHQHGYTSYCIGKWHNTPSEETTIAGPYDRWPTGSVFGFDRFYGFLGGDCDQWEPKLFLDREAVDPPATPEEGYHLSADLVDRAMSWISQHHSADPAKPWLTWLALGCAHAPHHVAPEWADKYKGQFDLGWDAYREKVLAQQKKLGIIPEHAKLAPMLEGVQKWDSLSADEKRLFARMAELYAGFIEHADAQLGRLMEFLERTGQLDNTLVFVFIGDNGSSGEGTLTGLFNEQSVANNAEETVAQNLARIDQFGQPGSYNHYPVGWAMAGNTPFQLCKQYTHFGGVRNPLIVHWPRGIEARGELRTQYHHCIDIVPTILEAIGVEAPRFINSVQQEPVEGYPMNYSFSDAKAPTNHVTQYFEMLGNRGLYHDGWKVVTYHGRKPWENKARWSFDEDHWELYNVVEDPTESNDLMKGRDRANLSDPMVKKLIELVGLWWAEAGRYQVLPLDDRFQMRALGRAGLYAERERLTYYEGAVRIQEFAGPDTKNRSWEMTAQVEVPAGDARGPVVALGGSSAGFSLYLKEGVPVFCYNFPGPELTYLRGKEALKPGKHVLRYEFEKTGPEPFGAGGTGRLFVDGKKVAEAQIPRTVPVGYSMDETFDVGWDKGTAVSPEYPSNSRFTGRVLRVDFDLKPDFHPDHADPTKKAEARFQHEMMRQ
ncbi:arylsulfatase [Myxococcus sp. CA033]|uniref:arylsulfatase n=1 Tax=Myxococcus sp. CA033 TaxID=2741516 RepID=UPI00352E2115